MTILSIRFAQALNNGRLPTPRDGRAKLLATLLRKRATARTVGADDLEALLRAQILWALPVHGEAVGIQSAQGF